MYLYSSEPFTSKVLSKLGLSATHFLDIGANRGWYSTLLKNEYSELKIFAFEPDKKIFKVLQENLYQFSSAAESVHLEHCGVGEHIGTASLTTYVEGNDGMKTFFPNDSLKTLSKEIVQIVTLDNYLGSFLDSSEVYSFLLKIDVEGSELGVILGGEKLITKLQPVIIMEINSLLLSHAKASSRKIFEFMEKLGYSFFWLDERERVVRVHNFDSPPHEALLGSASGANYLFLPRKYVGDNLISEWNIAKVSK